MKICGQFMAIYVKEKNLRVDKKIRLMDDVCSMGIHNSEFRIKQRFSCLSSCLNSR